MGEQDGELEIIEPENYRVGKDEFSNGELVMMAFRKCIELGSKEMREGYYNTKMDRAGNVNYIYVPDTRKELIEAVETLLMIMADDIEEATQTNIDEVLEGKKGQDGKFSGGLKQVYITLCTNEKDIWENASLMMKQQWNNKNIFQREGMLSAALPFATDYLIEKVSAYRKIVGILKKRIKDLNYYKEEEYHG